MKNKLKEILPIIIFCIMIIILTYLVSLRIEYLRSIGY